MSTFGETLKAAREAAKLTQQQLAQKVGLSQAAISKAEQASSVDQAGRPETVAKILASLGLPPTPPATPPADAAPAQAEATTTDATPESAGPSAAATDGGSGSVDEHAQTEDASLISEDLPPDPPPSKAPDPPSDVRRPRRLVFGPPPVVTVPVDPIVAVKHAIGRAFDWRIHDINDIRLVQDKIESSSIQAPNEPTLREAARLLLSTAAWVRGNGRPTVTDPLFILMLAYRGAEDLLRLQLLRDSGRERELRLLEALKKHGIGDPDDIDEIDGDPNDIPF